MVLECIEQQIIHFALVITCSFHLQFFLLFILNLDCTDTASMYKNSTHISRMLVHRTIRGGGCLLEMLCCKLSLAGFVYLVPVVSKVGVVILYLTL